ncbi:mucosa-associated lymphoid tissue lymphoma translocation protein 1-like [Mya arenaria]|uniref:mucosa-associated lymphoid tissue lymphoma translocation protein 1-like n=1 Tax=Mya arenaria TaxID=6604 RepID=UPI0022E11524|nr:mucosa-associated lymphoid tissue lymphoma translocation protein 1-like [Mya arenaria]
MPVNGLNGHVDFDGSVNDLPGNIWIKARGMLDTNPANMDWRALIRTLETSKRIKYRYKIKPQVVELWAPAISGESAAGKLLTELGSQGMTVGELRDIMEETGIDTFNLGLSKYEEIKITRSPEKGVDVHDGDPLVLEVEATGKPHPRFQWYFCPNGQNDFRKLQGHTEGILKIPYVTSANAGGYSCQIHNCRDPKLTRITEISLVSVTPNPNPTANGLNPPDADSLAQMFPRLSTNSPHASFYEGLENRSTVGPTTPRSPYSLILKDLQDVEVPLGESFTLAVETAGDPPIYYQWFHNEELLKNQFGPKLSMLNSQHQDYGHYYCIVGNGLRKERTRTASVTAPIRNSGQDHEITIISQPVSKELKFGDSALFMVEARCGLPLQYQWIKDGKEIEGATDFEYKIYNIQDASCSGLYQCEIKAMKMTTEGREVQSSRVFSNMAFLHLKIPSVNDNNRYNPHDKVALLIGNSDYLSEKALTAPPKDIQEMAESLVSINFKVVSLLNLTKPEIENAVVEFCKLIDKNVYAVFYFCGHGFEDSGVSYLVPTDAPSMYSPEECVNTSQVLYNFQKKNPALVFMVLDICRTRGKVKSSEPPKELVTQAQNGNVCYCYATSLGLAAFEDKNTQRGLLMRHLAPLLTRPIGIDQLVTDLKEEFSRNPKHSKIQIPEIRSNVRETRRSLTDKITHRGQTQAYSARTMLWCSYHDKPKKQDLKLPAGIVLQLDFQSDHNNILHIFVLVLEQGETQNCIAFVSNYSPRISCLGDIVQFTRKENTRKEKYGTKITLQDMQKLQDNLVVDITVKFVYNRDGKEYNHTQRVDLGLPLVSKLKLWKPTKDFEPKHRQPMEQEETDST